MSLFSKGMNKSLNNCLFKREENQLENHQSAMKSSTEAAYNKLYTLLFVFHTYLMNLYIKYVRKEMQ